MGKLYKNILKIKQIIKIVITRLFVLLIIEYLLNIYIYL